MTTLLPVASESGGDHLSLGSQSNVTTNSSS
jgi:hypothetical protein